MARNATEFDWYATESSPRLYPMEIIEGTFYYKGQNTGRYIPSGGTLFYGWGKSVSMHVGEPNKRPLPDRLEIKFYSYAEKQFYKGTFDLPYEEILSLFRQANIDRPGKPYYRSIMAGIAPGGAVSVWVNGAYTKEVFFGQAEKYDVLPYPTFGIPLDSKEASDAYIAKQIKNVLKPEELEALQRDGIPFGLWSRYRNLYKWIPVYTKGKESTDKEMFIDFLNGEKYKVPTRFSEEEENIPKPLPRDLQFSSKVNGEEFFYIIHFDEFELMEAFEKLGKNGEKVYIEFDPQLPRPQTRIRVYNDKESIELKKIVTEDW